ncbi:MAG: type I-U CRISPR-associated protein Cas8c [Leptonema illini]|uniref:Type I-U CRISPR-associated protein Cas8c n=1 Tax=Leptonema illini TaxID=183 RepID=A0A833GYX3_9LEPT|nr:MAG: type I-U CRISPR-associated protein Cas8c [Leptonema illini]
MKKNEPQIRIAVNPTNPGQFFACCGLLELADRLWKGAEGWFENDGKEFCVRAPNRDASLSNLLTAAKTIQLQISDDETEEDNNEDDEDSQADGSESGIQPIQIASPVNLVLDWWADKSLKTWAGSMNATKIFLAMCGAIDSDNEAPLDQAAVVYDTSDKSNASKKTTTKQKAREPFYFDARRGSNAWSIDVGFSADAIKTSQNLSTVAYPVVESLAMIGLQRIRPISTEKARVFDYYIWSTALPVTVVAVAVSGHMNNKTGFRFENSFRTTQKKHKAFNPAIQLPKGEKQ